MILIHKYEKFIVVLIRNYEKTVYKVYITLKKRFTVILIHKYGKTVYTVIYNSEKKVYSDTETDT